MKLIIEDDEGRKTVVPLVRDEITIGRQEGNTIRLAERNVSRRHARLLRENDSVLVEDLGSYNGVRVNGEKITGKTRIKEGDLVEIGDYDLGIQGKFEATSPLTTPVSVPRQTTIPPSAVKGPAAQRSASASTPQAAGRQQAVNTTQEMPAPVAAAQSTTPSVAAGGATAIIRVSDIMKGAPQVEARDLARSEMPRLVGLAGPFRGKEFYLMRTEVKFGRTDENDISLDHQSVSRQHCKFVLDQGQWKVVDNKSANGVRVNGEEYAVCNVRPGDTVELGHVKFRFCAPGEKFAPPSEKPENGVQKGGLKPTTAELIAFASQAGRGMPGQPQASWKGAKVALVGAIVVGAAALSAVAFFALGRKGTGSGDNGEGTGAAALKQGDALFRQHKYRAALEKYDLAGDAQSPFRKKAPDEARGEDTYTAMKEALDAGDGDKAKTLFEKCSAESTYWCQKAVELGDPVKATYAKKHLAAANAARSAGKPETCQTEVGNVLAFDSANAEAQSLGQQCAPHEAAKAEPAPRKEVPGAKERESKAARSASECVAKLSPGVKDFEGAVKSAQSALAQNPGDKGTLRQAYRCLGYGYAFLKDVEKAKKWLKEYRPYCAERCNEVDLYLAQHP